MEDLVRRAHAWYMEVDERSIEDAAWEFKISTTTFGNYAKKLGLSNKKTGNRRGTVNNPATAAPKTDRPGIQTGAHGRGGRRVGKRRRHL